jgi:hypothetical protein
MQQNRYVAPLSCGEGQGCRLDEQETDWPSADPTPAKRLILPCGPVPVCGRCAVLIKGELLNILLEKSLNQMSRLSPENAPCPTRRVRLGVKTRKQSRNYLEKRHVAPMLSAWPSARLQEMEENIL